jgi:Ca-activated chloride channel family protein
MIDLVLPWFLLIQPAPLLVYWLAQPYRPGRSSLQVPFIHRLAQLSGQLPTQSQIGPRRSWMHTVVTLLAWLAIVVACARPQWIEPPVSRTIPTRDLLVAIDLSGSMETRDFTNRQGQQVDRLTAVKEVLDDFLARREGDRVGMIVFGNAPFVLVPFTQDLQTCRQLMQEMVPRMAGPQTMLGDAIGKAIAVFESSDLDEQVLILLTDGNDTGSLVPPTNAAAIARDRGITVHVIGMGDPSGLGEAALDTKTLEAIADTTGGLFFLAQDRAALDGIYGELDRLSNREQSVLSYRPVKDVFHWPLGIAVFLILFWNSVQAVRQLVPRLTTGAAT